MNHAPRILASAAVVLALTGLGACGSDSSGGSASPSKSTSSASDSPSSSPSSSPSASGGSGTAASTAKIGIKDFAYRASGTVKPGAEVTVTNDDSEAHTVTADGPGGFDTTVPPGKSVTFKAPSKAGSYKYHCTFHSNMHGTLTVG